MVVVPVIAARDDKVAASPMPIAPGKNAGSKPARHQDLVALNVALVTPVPPVTAVRLLENALPVGNAVLEPHVQMENVVQLTTNVSLAASKLSTLTSTRAAFA